MTEHHDDTPACGTSPQGSAAAASPAVVGPSGPVGQDTGACLAEVSAAPVAFPTASPRPYPDPRPAGSAVSAPSAQRPVPAESQAGTLMDTLAMEVLVRGAERTVVRMPVDGARQVAGFLHGGASAALVETAASVAARAGAPQDSLPVGAELTVSHLRPVKEGWVTAQALPVHRGRHTVVYEVSIHDDQGRQVARGSLRSLFT
ncbi:PaaI family thioesterase [Actinomyces wuliandei]|uniref:PaaI family thioesterase n=1 Tax=Actinomyces wuliandei TaxID=2057743 RepID=UPI000FD9A436|nr:PaaI family thioesterase [Actinomyces wuliandei]